MSVLPRPVACTDALVLRSWPCGETSAIASYLTRDHGYVKVIAKAARRPRSQLRPLVEPGRLIGVEFGLDPGRQLQYLRAGSVHLDPLGTGASLERSAFLLGALELVDRCRPRDPEGASSANDGDTDSLFAVCEEFVRMLSSPTCTAPGLAFFGLEWNLLRLHGLAPELTACAGCGTELDPQVSGGLWFSLAEGGGMCPGCGGEREPPGGARRRLSAGAWTALLTIAGGGALAPAEVPWSRALRREIGALLHGFLGYHLPGYRLPAALDLLRPRKD
ncbi:hypothetical protein COW53_08360 [bacterium CG17_big_fil_post_rev_8_21_14_2_50_64_8]|nr:MAG: hypothetical protein COW53_08360 [bacterium CG17_big_fil_post_rev_8_21_14_2_50_64_8]PJA74673.1 MAG: hypothetical protein CO151_08760 [bacterium CG_4_9_14_3_um_filter_65_15]